MARRRSKVQHIAALALMAGAPLAAQSTNTLTAPTGTASPATAAPAPAPTSNAVGPPQLRDFSLGGRVTRPAETAAAPTPAPGTAVVAPPARTRPAPAPAPPTTAAPREATPARPAPQTPAPSAAAPVLEAPALDPAPPADAPLLPPLDAQQPPALNPLPSATPAAEPASPPWPWIAALLAAMLGAGFLWWRRQQRGSRRFAGYDAADQADLGALVAARAAGDAAPPPAPRRAPLPTNRPAPVASPIPAPAPPPAAPPPQPAAPAAPVGIVASGLKPRLELELVPLLAEVDPAGGAAITVDIIVSNRGSAPARDVIVDARMLNAAANVNNEVGQFFQQPTTAGQQVAMIPPMGSATLRVRLDADAARLAPILVEGRKLLVPVVAINAQYRWSGGSPKESASFLVGRGDAEAAKLAPFRLDLGARRWAGLAARLHSNGLEQGA